MQAVFPPEEKYREDLSEEVKVEVDEVAVYQDSVVPRWQLATLHCLSLST